MFSDEEIKEVITVLKNASREQCEEWWKKLQECRSQLDDLNDLVIEIKTKKRFKQ